MRPNKNFKDKCVLGNRSEHFRWGKHSFFLCRLRSMADIYGSCRCRHSPHCHTLGFQSITLEGMHQFHSNFTEGSSTIKYKSRVKWG